MEIHSFFWADQATSLKNFSSQIFLTSRRKFEKIIRSAHRKVAARFKFSISRFESDCRLIIGAQIVVGIYTLSCRNHLKFWWWLCFHHHKYQLIHLLHQLYKFFVKLNWCIIIFFRKIGIEIFFLNFLKYCTIFLWN